MIVADTNLIVALAMRGENFTHAAKVFSKDPDWHAPILWESEFRNAMTVFIRAGILNERTALEAFQIAFEHITPLAVSTAGVFRISNAFKLTGYDSEFAALAEWLDVKLVSSDTDLLNAGLAVHPKDF